MSTATIPNIQVSMEMFASLEQLAKDRGVSLQEQVVSLLEDCFDALEYEAFLAEHPTGWERADADEVAQIEALLQDSL